MPETIVRRQYDKLAATYDLRWQAYVTSTLSFLKNWISLSPQVTLLDIACGTGEFERLVLSDQPAQKMIGVDISEEMLAVARQKCHDYSTVSFHKASALNLPFEIHCFDVVISANAFHYFDDPLRALAEMKRVLHPNGTLTILDWCRDYPLCNLCDIVLKLWDPAHKQCYTQREFHHFLELAGLKVQQATRVRFGLLWGLMIATATPG